MRPLCEVGVDHHRLDARVGPFGLESKRIEKKRTAWAVHALHVGGFSGCLEDNAAPNLDCMVGEAFIKAPQESDINCGSHAVRPVLFLEQGEEVLVEFVHRYVVCQWPS